MFSVVVGLSFALLAFSCTNFLATSGAVQGGQSAFITYNNDGFGSWPSLSFSPATDWPNGTFIKGEIPQVPHTFNVVHLLNEKGVGIGETTWENTRDGLQKQDGAIIDYGLLMHIIVQRSSSAREAILNIGSLLDKWGYSSSAGETFSIIDPNEVWIMELVGTGNYLQPKLGAVWVAMRIPDGFVAGHANQARIQKFPLDDPDSCLYHPNTIQFARDRGWFNGPDKDFSFSDTYSPVTFESARWCEARVYDQFQKVSAPGAMDKYLDYVQGLNLTNRMPLWIKPEKLLSRSDVFAVMRSHYEGTYFDMVGAFDIGNQPFGSGDRFLPLKWKASNQKTYVFERPISIQKTAIAIISEVRSPSTDLPDGIAPIEWFSFDDTFTNCYVPLYSGLQEIPGPYKPNSGFSFDSAFWMLNLVSNYAYSQYDKISTDVQVAQQQLEGLFMSDLASVDSKAKEIYHLKGQKEAYEFVSNFSVSVSEKFLSEWGSLFGKLFMKYYDSARYNSGYDQKWYDVIAEKTGDHFLYRGKDPL